MLHSWAKLKFHSYFKTIALLILTSGVCLSNTLMTIGTLMLVAAWLVEAQFRSYWEKFKSTPSLWCLATFLCMVLLSLLWSENLHYGLYDSYKKLPFFAIPIVLGTSKPIEKSVVRYLLLLFLGTVCITSAVNYFRFHHIADAAADIRSMSYFIPHPRYAIALVLAIAVAIQMLKGEGKYKLLLWMPLLWCTYYTLHAQVLSGYVLLAVLSLFSGWLFLRNALVRYLRGAKYRRNLLLLSAVGLCGTGMYLSIRQEVNTTEGERPVQLRAQSGELGTDQAGRSVAAHNGTGRVRSAFFSALWNYLLPQSSSRDSSSIPQGEREKVRAAQNDDSAAVERTGVEEKMRELTHQWHVYQRGGSPDGHSLLQRLEHLKTGWSILKKNYLFGVGAGDVQIAFQREYALLHSRLSENYRYRTHNQWMTTWIAQGVLGVLFLLGFLVAPVCERKEKDGFFHTVLLLFGIVFLFQDVLETQAGVTLVGLFFSLVAYGEEEGTVLS